MLNPKCERVGLEKYRMTVQYSIEKNLLEKLKKKHFLEKSSFKVDLVLHITKVLAMP